jgi:O-antigen ligase
VQLHNAFHYIYCAVLFSAPLMPSNFLLRAALVVGGMNFLASLIAPRSERMRRAELTFLAFILWSFITLLWTPSTRPMYDLGIDLIGALCCFTLLSRGRRTLKQCEQFGWVYIAGCCLSSALVLQNWLSGIDFEGSRRYSSSDYINPNYVAYSIAVGFAVACFFLLKERPLKVARAFSLIAVLFGFSFVVLLTGSRGALISCLVAMIAGVNLRVGTGVALKVGLNLGIVAIAAIGFLLAPEDLFERFIFSDDYDVGAGYASGRFDIWRAAWETQGSLFAGEGYDSFGDVSGLGINAHNFIVAVTFEMGVVGLLMYLAVLFYVGKDALTAIARDRAGRQLAFVILLSWFPIALTGAWALSPIAWLIFSWVRAMSCPPDSNVFRQRS